MKLKDLIIPALFVVALACFVSATLAGTYFPIPTTIPTRRLSTYKGWDITQIYGTTPQDYPITLNNPDAGVLRAYIATKNGEYPLFNLDLSKLYIQIDEVEK